VNKERVSLTVSPSTEKDMQTMRNLTTAFVLSMALIASLPSVSLGQARVPSKINPSGTLAPANPGVVRAGTTLECSGKSYHVTTGSKAGKCENINAPDGKKIGVVCKDSQGNYGGASCLEGCLNSQGSGDCTKQ
jgi:hypothetical protein